MLFFAIFGEDLSASLQDSICIFAFFLTFLVFFSFSIFCRRERKYLYLNGLKKR